MSLVNWFDALWIGLPITCLVVSFGMRWTASPEDRGYVLLKQRAAALGVDVTRIPEPAWHSIVDLSIASAKDRAMLARASRDEDARNWQANLTGTLEEEALEISRFMQGATCKGTSVAPHILTEYRV
jgi:hypothetical protein